MSTAPLFNVSNKFGFLNVSESDEEDAWQKPKKPAAKKGSQQNASKKKPATAATGNVVGMATAASQNIIAAPAPGQGMSKNARRRANKKKKQAAEVTAAAPPENGENGEEFVTEEQIFQRQLEEAIEMSAREQPAPSPTTNGDHSAEQGENCVGEEVEVEVEEEEDLFLPVIEDIKNVIRTISKEDEIPITEIPLDNSTLYVKRALELQEINTEFKGKLNSLLRVGYKYKKRYTRERRSNAQLRKVIGKCDSSKKVELAKRIVDLEETEQTLLKQIEDLTEELEKERTKSRSTNSTSDKKSIKKVSFSET